VRELGLRIIQDSWTAKCEEILEATPDIVIASVPYQAEALAQILLSGVRFLGFAPKSMQDIYGDIAVIAKLVGTEEEGNRLVGRIQRAVTEVRRKTEPYPMQRVFCEAWGKPIIQSPRWVAELVAAAGGQFLGEPGKEISTERVRELRPELILVAWCGAGDRVPLEKIVSERNWTDTPAAKSARVYCISDELLNTPASTLLGGLQAIAWALHPESFPQPRGIRALQPL
jgi:iron complex transport system substrate-binding protein